MMWSFNVHPDNLYTAQIGHCLSHRLRDCCTYIYNSKVAVTLDDIECSSFVHKCFVRFKFHSLMITGVTSYMGNRGTPPPPPLLDLAHVHRLAVSIDVQLQLTVVEHTTHFTVLATDSLKYKCLCFPRHSVNMHAVLPD